MAKKIFYETFEEASKSFLKVMKKNNLKKTDIIDPYTFYQLYYKNDPLLPSNPQKQYVEAWTKNGGWPTFLKQKEKKDNFYSLNRAKQIIQKMYPVPKNQTDYRAATKKNARLHKSPDSFYQDFEEKGGWDNLLSKAEIFRRPNKKFYPNIFEAREALKHLGIKNFTAYKNDHIKDPKLPFDLVWYYGGEAVRKAFGSSKAFQCQVNGIQYKWET